jgi:hypothetical protein
VRKHDRPVLTMRPPAAGSGERRDRVCAPHRDRAITPVRNRPPFAYRCACLVMAVCHNTGGGKGK